MLVKLNPFPQVPPSSQGALIKPLRKMGELITFRKTLWKVQLGPKHSEINVKKSLEPSSLCQNVGLVPPGNN